ncbi:MAG: hypothetical protein AB7O97_19635 [Planctomycetota bacterium]
MSHRSAPSPAVRCALVLLCAGPLIAQTDRIEATLVMRGPVDDLGNDMLPLLVRTAVADLASDGAAPAADRTAVASSSRLGANVVFWCDVHLAAPCPDDIAAAYPTRLARAIERRLDRLLLQPERERLQDLVQHLQIELRNAQLQAAKVAEQVVAAGPDDVEARQRALFDLRGRDTEAELEARTERAMTEHLQVRLQEVLTQRQDAAARLRALEIELADAERAVRAKAAAGTADEENLRELLRERARTLDAARQTFAQADATATAMQEQLVTSSLALQRQLSRRTVLADMLARSEAEADVAAARMQQRRACSLDFERLQQKAEGLRAQLAEAERRQQALPTLSVTLW